MPGSANEDVVNKYLLYLEDPASIRDDEAIESAKADVDSAQSPVDKLIALSKVDRLENADPSELIEQFVGAAKAFSADNGITAGAWTAMGVPSEVLSRISNGNGRVSSTGAPRAKRVSAETVEAAIPSTPFTVKDVSELSGATAATVKNVIDRLRGQSKITFLGKDPNFTGQGARPNLYQKQD